MDALVRDEAEAAAMVDPDWVAGVSAINSASLAANEQAERVARPRRLIQPVQDHRCGDSMMAWFSASSMLRSSALPLPAMSNAVP
jgi:hypothetical protein